MFKRPVGLLLMILATLTITWTALPAWAQAPPPATDKGAWLSIIANFINTVLVLAVVQIAKTFIPSLKERAPYLLPILAGAVGPGIALVQNWLSASLGTPIDLSPITAIFTGATAVALNQIPKQYRAARLRALGLKR